MTSVARQEQWWRTPKGRQPHDAVSAIVSRLRRSQATRRDAYLHYARSYGGADIDGLGATKYAARARGFRGSSLAFNVIASAINTVQAKIAKNRPVPTFLTIGGDWAQQRRAKGLSRYVEAEFYRCEVYERNPLTVLDALVYGDGIVKVFRDDERIYVEREFPWRVYSDDAESQYGAPPNLYQRKPVDRQRLIEQCPGLAAALEKADNIDGEDEWGLDDTSDQLVVTEAWHLPSGKNATDGRHVMCVEGVTLVDEPYTKDYFPFVALQRNCPPMGVRGIGLAEELDGLQYEINFTARRVQESHRRMGGSYWAVENGSKVAIESLNNGIATIVRYSGTPPTPVHQQPVHPDTYSYLLSLIPKAFEFGGISQLAAQSQKPAGLNSGAALREYNDSETERFVVFAQSFENFHLAIAKQMIDLARELAEINPDYEATWRNKRALRRIKFKDVDLDADSYVMQCFPTSMLAKTPAGRIAQVQDLAKAGWITPAQGKRLLDFPDIERLNDLESAMHEFVEELIEKMLDEGHYEEPEEYLGAPGLIDALHTTVMAYYRAKLDGAPEANLRLLRQFMDSCAAALKELAGGDAPPANDNAGGPAPGMPPAAPLPPTGMYGPGADQGPPLPATGS